MFLFLVHQNVVKTPSNEPINWAIKAVIRGIIGGLVDQNGIDRICKEGRWYEKA